MDPELLKSRFLEKLNLFCFFHLGSDVESAVEAGSDRLQVSLQHHRIEPLKFSISYSQLGDLLEDTAQLESFLLDQVTPHRR